MQQKILPTRCAQTGKAEEICVECGAYQDVATLQDLDTPPENKEKTRISILRRRKILIHIFTHF